MRGLRQIRNSIIQKLKPAAGLRQYIEIMIAVFVASILLKMFVIDAVYVPTPSMEGTILSGDFILVNKLVYGATSPKHVPFSHAGLPSFRLPSVRDVERGDVVVFEFPENDSQRYAETPPYFVKRCVAKSGDTLSVNDGIVVVNGKPYPGLKEMRISNMVIPKRGEVLHLTSDNISQWEMLIHREGHSVKRGSQSEIVIDGIHTESYCVQKNYLFVLGDNSDDSYDSRYWGLLPEDNVAGEALLVYWSINPAKAIDGIGDLLSSVRWNRLGTIVR